jgi:hypothetical protein
VRIASLAKNSVLLSASILIGLLFLISFCTLPILSSTFNYDKNYNEGWDAYRQIAAKTGNIYVQHSPYVFTDYTPASFYLIGALSTQVDVVMVGRYFSIASFCAVLLLVAFITRKLGASVPESLFGVAVCIGLLGAHHSASIGIDDPQLLGTTIVLIALAIYISGRPTALNSIAILATVLIAGLVKQTLLAAPLAIVIDLLIRDRRRGIKLVGAGIILGAVATGVLYLIFGPTALPQIIAPRQYSLHKMATDTLAYLSGSAIALPVTFLFLLIFMRYQANQLVLIYLSTALIVGILLIGGVSTGSNHFIDVALASSIAAPVIMRCMREDLRVDRSIIAGFILISIYGPMLRIPYGVEQLRDGLSGSLRAEAQIFQEDLAFMASHPGDAFCHSPMLCLRAQRSLFIDPFNAGQAIRLGRVDPSPLFAKIARGEFAVIQLSATELATFDGGYSFGSALEPEFRRLLETRYVKVRNSGRRVFYVPR